MSVYDLSIGDSGTVDIIIENEKLKRRLLALGCVKGTTITVKKIAPLGDPIIINFRGFDMAIRKDTAKKIMLDNIKRG